MVTIMTKYILWKRNILADQLSYPDHIFSMECSPLPHIFDKICKEFDCPHMDLFVSRANMKLLIFVIHSISVVWKEDVFQHQRDDFSICDFSLFGLVGKFLSHDAFSQSLHYLDSSILATERVVHRPSGFSSGRNSNSLC